MIQPYPVHVKMHTHYEKFRCSHYLRFSTLLMYYGQVLHAPRILKLLAVWLLAAAMLSAFADSQPDPPAVVPHPNKQVAVSTASHYVSPTGCSVLFDGVEVFDTFPPAVLGLVCLEQTLRGAAVCWASASDSSPPSFLSTIA
jgi:hypothetical protein